MDEERRRKSGKEENRAEKSSRAANAKIKANEPIRRGNENSSIRSLFCLETFRDLLIKVGSILLDMARIA